MRVQSLIRHMSISRRVPWLQRQSTLVVCAIHYLSTNLILGAWPLPKVLHVVENISHRFVLGHPATARPDIDFASFLGK
jgi:hypothetical protein